MYYMLLIKVYGEKHLLRTLLVSKLTNFLGKTTCKSNRGKWILSAMYNLFFFLLGYLDNDKYIFYQSVYQFKLFCSFKAQTIASMPYTQLLNMYIYFDFVTDKLGNPYI